MKRYRLPKLALVAVGIATFAAGMLGAPDPGADISCVDRLERLIRKVPRQLWAPV